MWRVGGWGEGDGRLGIGDEGGGECGVVGCWGWGLVGVEGSGERVLLWVEGDVVSAEIGVSNDEVEVLWRGRGVDGEDVVERDVVVGVGVVGVVGDGDGELRGGGDCDWDSRGGLDDWDVLGVGRRWLGGVENRAVCSCVEEDASMGGGLENCSVVDPVWIGEVDVGGDELCESDLDGEGVDEWLGCGVVVCRVDYVGGVTRGGLVGCGCGCCWLLEGGWCVGRGTSCWGS